VTVYRVCDKKDSGPKTAYKQQFRSLSRAFRSQNIVTPPDPHRQCILDLQAWLESLVHQNHAIILNLDSNEDISGKAGLFQPLSYVEGKHPVSKTHDGSLATLITTCGLVDPLATQHKSRPFPSTYNRGQSRLDYMFVTSGILSSIIRSGILPYQSIFYSDHRPCFLDIDAGVLFEENTHEIVPPCRRQLQFNDPFLVEKYNELLQHQLAYQKIPEKLADLQKTVSLNGWSPADQVTCEDIHRVNLP